MITYALARLVAFTGFVAVTALLGVGLSGFPDGVVFGAFVSAIVSAMRLAALDL